MNGEEYTPAEAGSHLTIKDLARSTKIMARFLYLIMKNYDFNLCFAIQKASCEVFIRMKEL